MAHTMSTESVPPWINLPSLYYGSLLSSFLHEATLGGHPRDSPKTWDVTILSHPTLSPAIQEAWGVQTPNSGTIASCGLASGLTRTEVWFFKHNNSQTSEHISHLQGLQKEPAEPQSWVSDPGGLGWRSKDIHIWMKSQAMLMLLTHTLRICFNSSSQRRDLHSKVQTQTASIISERPPGCPQSLILNTVHRSRLMAKPKSVCLMLSEQTETETRSLEQRKAYLSQGLKARMGSSYSKARTLPTLFI